MLLNLPDPPGCHISRDYAGGFGIAEPISDETLLPIHLLYAASALKKSGYQYDILDAQVVRYDSSQIVNAIERAEPSGLISWLSLPSLHDDLALLSQIKKAKPDIIIIALGAVCNVMSEEILLNSNIDLVIKGMHPYYNLISNLCNILKDSPLSKHTFDKIGGAAYIEEGKTVLSSLDPYYEDLDQLLLDTYYELPLDKYMRQVPDKKGTIFECISIVTSVGCPYSCIYCPYPIGYGRKLIYKSIKQIVDEIDFIKNNFGINGFSFRSQLFTHNTERVIELCDEIIKRDLNIKWHVEARTDEVSKELLLKMKQAGCFRIHYGVETGSPEMLKKVGKPGLDVESIKKAFNITKELDIATTAHMMLGLPGENQETLKNSFDLLCYINPDVANLNITTPYPGTKLFEIASNNGWISTYDWSKYTSYDAIMSTGQLSANEIVEARKKMRRRFRNFKLLHDAEYRRLYLRSLPNAVRNRLLSLLKRLLGITGA